MGKRPDVFPKKTIRKTSKYMKRCSTSLVIRKMQIKTTVRYHACQNGSHQKDEINGREKGIPVTVLMGL